MTLNEFLQKIFMMYAPDGNNMLEVMDTYRDMLTTNHDYRYEQAFKDFVMTYKYRTLPTIATLSEFLKGYVIKTNLANIEYKNVYAWANGYRYLLAYNPQEQSYREVKYQLQQQGLIVHDSENEVKA